jgi:type I restriction enzyme S subunit
VSVVPRRERAETQGRFKPYPAYKHSGVEWLGEIPAHWDVRKTTWLFSVGSGTTPQSEALEYYGGNTPWVTTSELRESLITATEKGVTEAALRVYSSLKLHPAGSVVIAMYGATIGRLGILGIDATVNQACCVFSEPREIAMQFWYYWLQMRRPYLISLGYGGGQPNLSQDLLRSIRVPTPPGPEQRVIAVFLDRETARLDALVAKKERLIELLREQRTALITRAVTKGLDPTVPMKDSRVEWLGEIPSHWVSLAISRITLSRCDGPFGSGLKSEHYSDSGVRVIRLQNIGWTEFLETDEAYLNDAYARQLGDHSVLPADLLIAGLGDEGHPVGRACVAPDGIGPAMVKADCFRFRLDQRRVLPRFAAYQMSATASAAAGSLSTGATRARMNLTTTASRKVGLPPLNEQLAIVNALDKDGDRNHRLVAKVSEAIDRLKEFRSALISAAVTGKIDVREVVA